MLEIRSENPKNAQQTIFPGRKKNMAVGIWLQFFSATTV